jgi:2-polyprenyl-6-methoxyphenol hydroxylase-like FAD-dependent oxidoreductase
VPLDGGEIYGRERRMIGAWPTNDGLVPTYVAGPAHEFHAFRSDVEGNLLASLDLVGDLGERVRAGSRAERIYGTANTANYFRAPHGPGWALVGDAGLAMDPVTGQGISDALRDAELLSDAIAAGLHGEARLDAALSEYERARNTAVKPMYGFTLEIAAMAPPKLEQLLLFEALQGDVEETRRFIGLLTAAVPVADYFSPGNLRKLIGLRGFAKIARSKLLRGRPAVAGARV